MNSVVPRSGSNNNLTVDIDYERLKYFFYMMQGESASRTKVLGGAILITKKDIERLVVALVEKLRLAHVRDFTVKIGVGFESEIVEKHFEDFVAYAWGEPKKTEEVIVKINFMYEDYDSGNPLKHSLFIRIAREINPANFFQILASGDNEKLDAFDSMTSPVFCRTDHVNDELSKALINTVVDWHKGQKQPQLLSKSYEFAKKHNETIARFVHYSFPAVSAMLMCLVVFKISSLFVGSELLLPSYISTLILAVFFNSFFMAYGNRRAAEVFHELKKMSDEDVIFEITQGDNKDYSERVDKNREAFRSAKAMFIWAMVKNVVAGIIVAVLFEYLKKWW